jgi:type I restriction enzyme S subunit
MLRDFPDFSIELPPISEQLGIAATLGSLDDKIESNRRAIDLDVELAIALLSVGTERIRVGDVATVSKGLSYKGAGLDDGTTPGASPMVNLASFTTSGRMKSDGLKYYTGDHKQSHVLSELELIVANTDLTQAREILGRGFLVPPSLVGAIHTHHTSVIRFGSDGWMVPFLWAHLQSAEFRDRAKGFATGTTVTALPAEALLDFEFVVPQNPAPASERALSLVQHSWHLADENECLARTRDALLPELLSGRIRVPEAQEAAAEVSA